MARIKKKLPSFNSVGAGQAATVDVPVGPRYHNIKIFYKDNASQATILSDIEMVNVKVNGKIQRSFKPAELYLMLAMNGVAFEAGIIPIYFSEPWRRNVVSEDMLAWATAAGVSSFQIEVILASGATAPKLHAYAAQDNLVGKLENIIKYRRQSIPVSSTGALTLTTLPKLAADKYHRIHCFENTAGDIAGAECKMDGFEVFNANAAINTSNMLDHGIVAQDGLFTIAFDETQRYDDALVMQKVDGSAVQDWQVIFDMAAANDFQMLIELRGSPD